MSINNALIAGRLRPWLHRLLLEPLPEEASSWREKVIKDLKVQAYSFQDRFNPRVSKGECAHLNAWYASTDGQAELLRLSQNLWTEMSGWSATAMPAHDARHAMYKVPADAIEHMTAEHVLGWERVGLIGALLHDYGRWPEERIFGGAFNSAHHARMSFVLAREFLLDYRIPEQMRDHLLHAVLGHTRGAKPEDPMVYKIVVAADRTQLYGPERILRSLHHRVNLVTGEDAHIYGPMNSSTLIAYAEKYATTRLEGPLFARSEHYAQLWKDTFVFLIRADTSEEGLSRLEKVLTVQSTLPEIYRGVAFADFVKMAMHLPFSQTSLESMCGDFLNSRHVAPNPIYKQAAMAKLNTIPGERLIDFASAMSFMRRRLQEETDRQHQALSQCRAFYEKHDPFVSLMIDLVDDLLPNEKNTPLISHKKLSTQS